MKKIILLLTLAMAPQVQAASQLEDMLATMVNLNGHLCADVTRMYMEGGDTYRIICSRYRSGSGESEYIVNMLSGNVRWLR